MIDKPECELCEQEQSGIEGLAEDLLYALFNPYYQERGNFDVSELIKKYLNEDDIKKDYEIYSNLLNDLLKSFGYINPHWLDKLRTLERLKRGHGKN